MRILFLMFIKYEWKNLGISLCGAQCLRSMFSYVVQIVIRIVYSNQIKSLQDNTAKDLFSVFFINFCKKPEKVLLENYPLSCAKKIYVYWGLVVLL